MSPTKALLIALVATAAAAGPASAGGLTLSIQNGRVTLDAQDVTVREILAEWARVGRTRIVNIERLAGSTITLKLDGVPEKQALDVVLRAIPGYMAVPRDTFLADASTYDRILLMPVTAAVAAIRQPAPATPPGFPANTNFTQMRPMLPPPPGAVEPNPMFDQMEDPAIAAAAAAGLVTAPAPLPGVAQPAMMPFVPPGTHTQPQPGAAPAQAPTNPWNAPTGTAQPSLAPTPPPSANGPNIRPRPPQPPQP